MFGSYNKFHHKVHVTATVISSLDFLTSIISSVVIFSVLGAQKKATGLEFEELVKGGQGLAFIAYPEALANLPVWQLWSVMFFFMLFLLGLDSEFALLETVLTSLYDGLPVLKRFKPLMTFLLCSSCFLLSLPCVSQSGAYVFNLMDNYGGGMSVMWIAITEMIGIMWFYGANNFAKDLNFMLKISMRGCWAAFRHYFLVGLWIIIPLLLLAIQGLSLSAWLRPTYSPTVLFPEEIHYIGYFLVLVSAAQVPIWAVFTCLHYVCWPSKRAADMWRPTADWGPGDRQQRKLWQAERAQQIKGQLVGYENPAMAYPYYNYAGYHSYHM